MLKIYFDNVLIDEDSYTTLSNEYKLFTDSFKLGSVACNSFKLSVNKSMVENHPSEVKIEDDNTTFYLIVDSITEDKYVYNYTLVDKLINFNFNYDAKPLIDLKKENEEPCYLSDIWHDMCMQAGVEYDDNYTFLNDITVDWYDNTIQARKYLSYIAELQGGYACILENGKQSFKPYKKASSKTIDIDECADFILGEKKKITRVVYDNGVVFWSFGDDTGTTLYLDTNNVFITTEEQVEEIYNTIVDFEFYLVKVPDAPMDSNIRAGDIITFTDGDNEYPTIAQYSMSYGGAWVGSYELEVKTDKQEETKVIGTKEIVKKIETKIDRTNAELKITAEKTEENESKIVQLAVGFEEIDFDMKRVGGDNLVQNSGFLDGLNKWSGALLDDSFIVDNTDNDVRLKTLSKSALELVASEHIITGSHPIRAMIEQEFTGFDDTVFNFNFKMKNKLKSGYLEVSIYQQVVNYPLKTDSFKFNIHDHEFDYNLFNFPLKIVTREDALKAVFVDFMIGDDFPSNAQNGDYAVVKFAEALVDTYLYIYENNDWHSIAIPEEITFIYCSNNNTIYEILPDDIIYPTNINYDDFIVDQFKVGFRIYDVHAEKVSVIPVEAEEGTYILYEGITTPDFINDRVYYFDGDNWRDTTLTKSDLRPYFSEYYVIAEGSVQLSDITLKQGIEQKIWSPAPGEVYGRNIKFDLESGMRFENPNTGRSRISNEVEDVWYGADGNPTLETTTNGMKGNTFEAKKSFRRGKVVDFVQLDGSVRVKWVND